MVVRSLQSCFFSSVTRTCCNNRSNNIIAVISQFAGISRKCPTMSFFTMTPLLSLAISMISAQCLTENDVSTMMDPTSKISLTDACFDFALECYYAFEKSLNRLRSQMNESPDYEYKIANKFWITNSRKLRDCMFDFFGDQMQVTDFRINPAEYQRGYGSGSGKCGVF